MTTPPTKRGRGRPRKPPQDSRRNYSLSLSPAEHNRLLAATATRNASEAIRKILATFRPS